MPAKTLATIAMPVKIAILASVLLVKNAETKLIACAHGVKDAQSTVVANARTAKNATVTSKRFANVATIAKNVVRVLIARIVANHASMFVSATTAEIVALTIAQRAGTAANTVNVSVKNAAMVRDVAVIATKKAKMRVRDKAKNSKSKNPLR